MTTPLFCPFRALGYITDKVPFAVQRKGKETFVLVSVGKSWQIYNCAKLLLSLVGPQLKHTIRALACKGDLNFAAVGTEIVECKRIKQVGCYRGHTEPILQLLVLGDHLLSLGGDGQLLVWRIGDYGEPEYSLRLAAGFHPTCMAHPDTYLNKVVVGAEDGRLQLWNFHSGKMLFEFPGWGSAVRCISPSPALDVVGVGLADGRAVLHNLKFDETLASFGNAGGVGLASDLLLGSGAGRPTTSGGGAACTAITFRTGAGVPLMAAGGGAGVVTVWNLEERRLMTILKDAHDAPLVSLHFFAGEPLLMSSSADNSIKHWAFDLADGTGRLLRFRSGHAAPPTAVRHYGQGLRLLSASQDRALRLFSTIQDQQSRELSQQHVERRAKRLKVTQEELKLPRLLAMDACEVRERDWANVISAHEGDPCAYTWRLQHFTMGQHVLRPPPDQGQKPSEAPVTTVALSRCGNFGFVGSAAGRVDRYNMQSGIHRGVYGRKVAGAVQTAHDGAVTGLACDGCNKLVVTGGLDSRLRVWNFKGGALRTELDTSCPVATLRLHATSLLCAAACDDHVVRMFDVEAGRLVRRLKGHRDRITDLDISEDGRWLLSASMDGTVRAWDVPASQCLQVMHMGPTVTSLSLSPTMELLATTHVGRRGVYLWSNQLLFGNPADIAHSERAVHVALPSITTGHKQLGEDDGESRDEAEGMDLEDDSDAFSSDDEERSSEGAGPGPSSSAAAAGQTAPRAYDHREPSGAPTPITPQMVTLSMLPRSQWENLLHLDAIKARNKPTAPPKKPEAAPFFLPTTPSLSGNPVFATQAVASTSQPAGGEEVQGGKAASRVVRSKGSGAATASQFMRLLHAGSDSGDYSSFMGLVRGMSPAAVDREIRGMALLTGATDEEVRDVEALLCAIQQQLDSSRDFELANALLQVVLQVHGEAIMDEPRLRGVAERIKGRLQGTWARVDRLLQSVRCMVNFFGNFQG